MAGNQLVQSVLRAVDLLEAVSASEGGLSLADLSEQVGLNPTTTHNLARTLVARGLLEKTTRPTKYRLGAAAFDLVRRQQDSAVIDRVEQVLLDLSRRVPEATLLLARPRGVEVATVLRISPQRPGVVDRPSDRRLSPYVSASDVVHIAYADSDHRLAHAREFPFEEFGGRVYETYEDFIAAADRAAAEGGVILTGRSHLLPMAVPLWQRGELVGVMGLAIPHEHVEQAASRLDDVHDTAGDQTQISGSSDPDAIRLFTELKRAADHAGGDSPDHAAPRALADEFGRK